LSGFISPTGLTRSNRKEITFFVNGRWVQDSSLNAALLQAYHTLLMVGRYPLAVLFLEVPPAEVDVNVHPAKTEVRFRNPDKAFSFVLRSARRAILAFTPVPQLAPQNLWGGISSQPREIDPVWSLAHDVSSVEANKSGTDLNLPGFASFSNNESQLTTRNAFIAAPNPPVPILRLIGQIGATYLVAEGPDGMYLIDQHAAHERVLFEKLMAQHDQKAIPSQALLSPVVVQLTPGNAKLLDDQLPVLQHFGFHVEPFGQNSYQVRAMPSLFSKFDPAAALRAFAE
jgi:DNA mismatch repair protein MutL